MIFTFYSERVQSFYLLASKEPKGLKRITNLDKEPGSRQQAAGIQARERSALDEEKLSRSGRVVDPSLGVSFSKLSLPPEWRPKIIAAPIIILSVEFWVTLGSNDVLQSRVIQAVPPVTIFEICLFVSESISVK